MLPSILKAKDDYVEVPILLQKIASIQYEKFNSVLQLYIPVTATSG